MMLLQLNLICSRRCHQYSSSFCYNAVCTFECDVDMHFVAVQYTSCAADNKHVHGDNAYGVPIRH